MSLEKIHLRKLLLLFYLEPKRQKACLRDIIRDDRRKADGLASGGGGDFHTPFWSDAKNHAFGESDLEESTEIRIEKNRAHRGRLYPLLKEGFLKWWNENRRWRNEPYERVSLPLPKQFILEASGCTVKIDKLLTFKVGDGYRVIYPYFAEIPVLSPEAARIALWILSVANPKYDQDSFRILDVLRAKNFGIPDVTLDGNEQSIFQMRYQRLWELYEITEQELENA